MMKNDDDTVDVQCIQKVFRPIYFFLHFVMLQPDAKIISIIIFSSSFYTEYTIMTKQKPAI